MKKYRSKPMVVEAMQWFEQSDHDAIKLTISDDLTTGNYWVSTTGGVAATKPGDWLILESNGRDVYPCTDEVFKSKYEAVFD